MSIRRIAFLFNSAWELVRFVVMFLLAEAQTGVYQPVVARSALWLLAVAAGQLLMPAVLLFLYVDPRRYSPLLNLARLGKAVGIFVSLVLLATGALTFVQDAALFGIPAAAVLLAVTFLDLIFLFFLVSYREVEPPGTDQELQPSPDHRETDVTDPSQER